MLPSDRFRRQHEELEELAQEILLELDKPTFPSNAREVRRMMARFKGKLIVHGTMENEALYPRLLAHEDEQVRVRSQALFDDLGGVYDAFTAHHAKWTSVEAIERDAPGYVRQTRDMFATLRRRLTRENSELYPLADRDADHRASVRPPDRAR
jgi:hypothetical protein